MSNITIYSNALSSSECAILLSNIKTKVSFNYESFADYPGRTVTQFPEYLELLRNYAYQTNTDNNWYETLVPKVIDGMNILKYEPGMSLGPHIDKPITQYDEQGNFLQASQQQDVKLTALLALSNSDDYTGGKLSYYTGNNSDFYTDEDNWTELILNIGDILVFNNPYTPHQVSELLTGTRYMLAGWFC